ncbi:MAG: hypothetical protein KKD01_18000 [Proteobacteria bacterium]|nr:hypothetical protein [Pseudomonadota bacterium]
MTGKGPKRLGNSKKENYFFELEKWGKEISKSDNLEWMTQQIDQTFPMFKEWRKRKEESENSSSEIPDSKIA